METKKLNEVQLLQRRLIIEMGKECSKSKSKKLTQFLGHLINITYYNMDYNINTLLKIEQKILSSY